MPKRMALCAIKALAGLTCLFAGQALSAAPLSPKAAALKPCPAIWKIADADTTIYLFGTTHSLPPGLRWKSPAMRQIIRKSQELVVESLETPDAQQKTDATVDAIVTPVVDQRPILSRVAPEKRDSLKQAILRTDFPEQFFDAMPSFMASLVLAVEDMARDGRDRAKGVEATLIKAFRRHDRPIIALEDGSAVLRQMHGLSEDAQRHMLEATISDIADTKPHQPADADLGWARGDTAIFDAEFRREKLGDELYDLLILNRNKAWADWLHARMARPGVVLFAVGAGHFAGPDALPRLLEQRGIWAVRVE